VEPPDSAQFDPDFQARTSRLIKTTNFSEFAKPFISSDLFRCLWRFQTDLAFWGNFKVCGQWVAYLFAASTNADSTADARAKLAPNHLPLDLLASLFSPSFPLLSWREMLKVFVKKEGHNAFYQA